MTYKNLDIIVDISLASAPGSLGFGYPLILETSATKALDYTKITGLKELADKLGTGYENATIYKVAQLMFMQENAPSEIAVCQSTDTAITALTALEEKDWRQLVCIIGSSDTTTQKDISTAIEAMNYKMYFPTDSDESKLADYAGNKRTVAYFHDTKEYASAALVGASAGREVGSFTYKNLILKGVDPLDLTSAELSQLNTANAITNVSKCGDNVTTEGKTASGEYIDLVDSIDYVKSQIEYRVQKLLNNSPKLPYTNAGIASIEAEVIGVLEKAFSNGIIADEEGVPQYTTNFKAREEMSVEDRANRSYTGGNFEFAVAGAIHTVKVSGQLII